MRRKNKLLASILGLLMVVFCGVGSACGEDACLHQWSEWTTTTQATCTVDGAQERKCSKCGETETSTIEAPGHDWEDATCTEPKTCITCSATDGEALGHSFTVETVKTEALKTSATCTQSAVYYKSCGCGLISEDENDVFTDGDPLGHTDKNFDHICDNGCNKTDMGNHVDKDDDDDHVCDYGCGEVLEACADKDGDNDHACDVCGKKDLTGHKFAPATCDTPKTCSECGLTDGDPLGHTDKNFDHICDNGCDKTDMGKHADADDDDDHVCDYGCNAVLEACADKDGDNDHDCDVCGKKDLTGHKFAPATCDTPKTCSECGLTDGDPLGHTDKNFDHICDNGCNKTDMGDHADKDDDDDHVCDYGCGKVLEDCADEDGDNDHACDVCGKADVSGHKYSEATCGAPATCGECGATTGTTLDHTDKNFDHTCDNGCGKTDMGDHADKDDDDDHVCDYGCGAVLEACVDTKTDKDHNCDVCGKADVSTHDYVVVAQTEATCYSPATITYACDCGDTYVEEDGDALDHDITGVKAEERHVADCEYVLVYVCQRENCGEEVFGEAVYHHDYIASITKPATCQAEGQKTLTCADCGHVNSEYETIPVDKTTGHSWKAGEADENGKRSDTCLICGETKTVIVSTGNSASSKGSELAKTDLQLKVDEETSASIQLGEGVGKAIGDKDITVSAGVVDEQTLKDMGISEEKLGQIGGNTVYDFNIKDDKGESVSDFGKENFVTITLPYKLDEGEDIDSIAVWFISDTCQDETCDKGENCVEAHKLVSIKATYNNGYVTFQTNHFSIYTVTRLTPEQRCQVYGHGYALQHVEGSCTKDGYDLYVCVRCHDKYIDLETYEYADGHDYVAQTYEATCTQSGYVQYTCDDCGHTYKTKLNALGHAWSVEENVEATCMADGYIKYDCDNCDEEYVETLAKLPHVYTNTVVETTCTADGYVFHDCDNCEYSYKDGYVSALGHAYAPADWVWTADYTSATLVFVCENDETHVTSVIATVEKAVVNGTCSDFVKTTYTATVSYDGAEYTDEKIVQIGTPGHSFGEAWERDDEEHWHECICGERTDINEHVFENPEVTKDATCNEAGEGIAYCVCGATKIFEIPATGEHNFQDGVCVDCGAEPLGDYYLNLIGSFKNVDGVAVKVQDLSVVVKESVGEELAQEMQLEGSVKQIDLVELAIYMEDGELCGALTGSLLIYNGPIPYAEANVGFKGLISDGYVYFTLNMPTETMSVKVAVSALMQLITSSMMGGGSDAPETERMMEQGPQVAPTQIVGLLTDTVLPMVEDLIQANPKQANALMEKALNMIFTFEQQEDGSYIATLDYEKLYALNDNLANKPVSAFIDIYFGEGVFDGLIADIQTLLAMPVSELPAYLTAMGLDVETLVAKLNEICMSMGAPADYDIGAILTDPAMANVALGMLLFEVEDDSYIAIFNSQIEPLRTASVYALLGLETAKIKATVDGVLGMLSQSISLSFTTDATGALLSVKLDVNELFIPSEDEEMDYYSETTISVEIEIILNGRIDVDWGNIIDEIEDSIVLPSDDMLPEDTQYESYYSEYGSITFQGQTYYVDGMVVNVMNFNYDEPVLVMIENDCQDWKSYSIYYQITEYTFLMASVEDLENVQGGRTFLIDMYSGEIVELIMSENGFIAVSEDGTQKEVAIDFSAFETISEEQAYAMMYFATFENAQGETQVRPGMRYFYNAELKTYAMQSQHELEYAYETVGETCEGGVLCHETCKNCDYHGYSYTEGCDMKWGVQVDLTSYGVCGGTAEMDVCTRCGNVRNMYNFEYTCNAQEVVEEIVDANGNVVGSKTTTACADCGFVIVAQEWEEWKTTCECVVYRASTVSVGETVIFEYKFGNKAYAHEVEYSYEVQPGATCDEPYVVHEYCTKCNEGYTYTRTGHFEMKERVQLDEFGLCGGYIQMVYCDICQEVLYSDISDYMCAWRHIDETEDGWQVYECGRCGAIKRERSYQTEVDEKCRYKEIREIVYSLDGEDVYSVELVEQYTSHDYSYAFNMHGESCEDGYTVLYTCKNCDYTYEEESYYHNTYVVFELDDEHSGCGAHSIEIRRCPCGQYFEPNYNGFYYDEELSAELCSECGLAIWIEEDEFVDGCFVTTTLVLIVKDGEEELYRMDLENVYVNHDFAEVETAVVDGKTIIYSVCQNCSTSVNAELLSGAIVPNEAMGDVYYDYVFTPEVSATYSITSIIKSDVFVTLYVEMDGRLKEIAYNDDGAPNKQFHLSYYLEAGNTYVYRMKAYDVQVSEVSFIFVQDAVSSGVICEHYKGDSFSIFPEGATSCEDGVLVGQICTQCGRLDTYAVYGHDTMEVERVELTQFGACYGEIVYYACACGQENYVSKDFCAYNTTKNEYYDEEGRLNFVEVRACNECGLRYTLSYYVERDASTCVETKYYTEVINVGATLVSEREYTVSETVHNDKQTATLMNGEGSTCYEGVIITNICQDCGREITMEEYSHEMVEKERVDLAETGSVCGGTAILYACACGYNTHMNISTLCDNEYDSCSVWVEGVITNSQIQVDGSSTWFDGYAEMYVCAVTDPVESACGYTYRTARYWLPGENCRAYEYQTWQFGYNQTTGECVYELTIKTGNSHIWHDYVANTQSTDSHDAFTYDCPNCGSYVYEDDYYDEYGRTICQEFLAENKLNDGRITYRHWKLENVYNENGEIANRTEAQRLINSEGKERLTKTINENRFDENGSCYYEYERFEEVDWNGEETWSESCREIQSVSVSIFDEPSTNASKVIETYSNSYGDNNRQEEITVWYSGYYYDIYRYYEGDGYWRKYEYSYSFLEGCCLQTTQYTDSDGNETTEMSRVCKMYDSETLRYPTCTQPGLEYDICAICNSESEVHETYRDGHHWVRITDGWYYCANCGLENANGASGDIVMEDLTDDYGEGELYVIGYYVETNVEFTYYVSLISGGEELAIVPVEFTEIDGLYAIAFSKSSVEIWAEENGYTDYDVRFSFVPIGSDGSFDYGITFTQNVVPETITGRVSFTDTFTAGERKSYTIAPTEDGVWVFTSYANLGDTEATLYDSEGNELSYSVSDWYGEYCISYELEAGKTYTLETGIRGWGITADSQEMTLMFGPETAVLS